MKSKVHPRYKTKYRVANWAAYKQALVRRGDVTVWVSSEAIAAWTPGRSGRRGGQRRYSDLAIETALTLRLLYHLPLRQAEGFLHALFGMMRLNLSVPDYTTLSRRSVSPSAANPSGSLIVIGWSGRIRTRWRSGAKAERPEPFRRLRRRGETAVRAHALQHVRTPMFPTRERRSPKTSGLAPRMLPAGR